jgi:hypothetical protein
LRPLAPSGDFGRAPSLSSHPPPLPEMPTTTDPKHVAMALGNYVVWLHHHWPKIVRAIRSTDAQMQRVESEHRKCRRERLVFSAVVALLLVALAVFAVLRAHR